MIQKYLNIEEFLSSWSVRECERNAWQNKKTPQMG